MLGDYLIPGTDTGVERLYSSLPGRAQNMHFGLIEDEVVILDTETTGLDPVRCSLIEIAALRMSGADIVDEFQTFVDPGCRIPEEITELTGISQKDIVGAPPPQDAVEQLAAFCGEATLVAHNATFDRSFIMRQAKPGMLPGAWVDTLGLAQIVLPRLRTHRLAGLSRAFDLPTPSHRAIDDTRSLAALWRILLAALQSMTPGLAAYIAGLSPHTNWPLRTYFRQAALEYPGVDFSLRHIRSQRVQAAGTSPRLDADELPLRFPDDFAIEDAFAKTGAAGAMYDAYEQRDEQVAMALEVTAALRNEDIRVLEAGTGVGKSMAYLLPCALGARENRITMGIATKTNALMDQLVYHELPRLAQTIDGLSFVALKGYDHYLCLRKLEHMARDSEEDEVATIQMIAMLLNYTAQTDWGDLDAVNLHWYGLPRAEIQASPHDCLKKRCPYFPRRCYLHGARRYSTGADIVVTNHALLFRDMQADNGILPPIRHWVIDEAHSVESEARRQLSHAFSARDLEGVLRRLAHPRSGLVDQIRAKAGKLDGGDILFGVTADVDNRIGQIQSEAAAFFAAVKGLAALESEAGTYSRMTIWVSEGLRESGEWKSLSELGLKLADKTAGLNGRLSDLLSMIEQFEGEFTGQQADLSGIIRDLEAGTQALRLILEGTNNAYVYSVQLDRDPQRNAEILEAERLDIGETLASELYPQMKSVVFASATLATGEKEPFAHFLRTTGLDRIDPQRVHARMLASSYDFDRNMTIFLPSDMPEPNERDYHTMLAHLLQEVHAALGGSVLTLFTNRREMEGFYGKLKPLLAGEGLDLVAQTRGTSTKALRDRFLAEKKLSLFALKSFWEGFDAPGDTLRCVIIVKLPFGRPTDPIAREREVRESRAAWRRYSLPEAVMDLKQAAGRLIRNSTDSGWLVLADARLQTKNYAGAFLRAMPTHDIRTCTIEEIAQTMRNETPGLAE